MRRTALTAVGLLAVLCGALFFSSVTLSQQKAESLAENMIVEEMNRRDLDPAKFQWLNTSRDGLTWIVTWSTRNSQTPTIGATIALADINVWTHEKTVPDCKFERERTEALYGSVCGSGKPRE